MPKKAKKKAAKKGRRRASITSLSKRPLKSLLAQAKRIERAIDKKIASGKVSQRAGVFGGLFAGPRPPTPAQRKAMAKNAELRARVEAADEVLRQRMYSRSE